MDSLSIDPPSYDLSHDKSQRALKADYYRNMTSTPQFAPTVSKIDGKSEHINDTQDLSILKNSDDSLNLKLNQKLLMWDTINQREETMK